MDGWNTLLRHHWYHLLDLSHGKNSRSGQVTALATSQNIIISTIRSETQVSQMGSFVYAGGQSVLCVCARSWRIGSFGRCVRRPFVFMYSGPSPASSHTSFGLSHIPSLRLAGKRQEAWATKCSLKAIGAKWIPKFEVFFAIFTIHWIGFLVGHFLVPSVDNG